MRGMKTIETPRLLLRGFCQEDAGGLWKILAFPRAACFVDEKLSSFGEAVNSARWRSQEPAGTQVAVCLKEKDTLIGYLFGQAEDQATWSVGWNFNAVFCGHGYALEAARAYLTLLFAELGARRIYAYAARDNGPSLRLCERLGMRLEGVFKEFVSFTRDASGKEIFEDTCMYAILAKEWRSAHALLPQEGQS